MKEYKVIQISGGFMAGGIKAEKVQNLLNENAVNGWIVIEAVSHSTAGADSLLIIFEREK